MKTKRRKLGPELKATVALASVREVYVQSASYLVAMAGRP
jgi:hypothetical protein